MFLRWLRLVFPPKKYYMIGSLLLGFLLPLFLWSVVYLSLPIQVLVLGIVTLVLFPIAAVVAGCAIPASRNKDLGPGWYSIGFILAGLSLPLLPVPAGIWEWEQSCCFMAGGGVILLYSMGYGAYRCSHHD